MKNRWPVILLAFVMLAAVACAPSTETATPGLPYAAPESTQAADSQEATQVSGTPQPTPVPASLEREEPHVLHSRGSTESEVEDPITALPGDRVWTEEHGRALLKWPDMHLRLYDDTGMHVEDITPTWLHLALDAGAALNGAVPVIEQRLVWTTDYAVITTTATTIMVAYHPDSQLTVLRVFDGRAEMRNLTGEEQVEIVEAGEWALVEADRPPRVSDRLEEMRGLARELDLWDVFHEIELDVRDGFGPEEAHVPPEDVEIVFVLCKVVTEELSLRTGPSIVYEPPIRKLAQDTELKPLARSVDGGWIQVLVEETGEEGWISADPRYVSCNIDVTSLEIATAPEPTAVPCIPQPPADWQQYVVQWGDTLYSLAREGGTTVQAVMQVNCLTDATIVQGQWLWLPCIPQPPAGWQLYAVEWGDTLTSLARNHGTTVEDIKRVNCLTDEVIQAGEWLWLPPRSIPETITIDLEADADAYVIIGDYYNHGSEPELIVYSADWGEGYYGQYQSFIHFDLSPISAGAKIEDATLLLYLVGLSQTSTPPNTITVTRVLSDWTETGINGSSPPDTNRPESAASARVNGTPGDYGWNVTSLVQSWVDGTNNNYGLMLWDTWRYSFSSRDSTEYPPPRLRIRYIEP
jgi:LysM repeat protein